MQEIVRLQFIENLPEARLLCYKGMDVAEESDRKDEGIQVWGMCRKIAMTKSIEKKLNRTEAKKMNG